MNPPTSARMARTYGSHWRRPWIGSSRSTSSKWYPVLRCVKTEPDSSRAATATSTTSSTFLRACSLTPTFFPVVQNRQASLRAQ